MNWRILVPPTKEVTHGDHVFHAGLHGEGRDVFA